MILHHTPSRESITDNHCILQIKTMNDNKVFKLVQSSDNVFFNNALSSLVKTIYRISMQELKYEFPNSFK